MNKDSKKSLRDYLDFLEKQPKGYTYSDRGVKTSESRLTRLTNLYNKYKQCKECPLGTMCRTQVVFGDGNENASLMFVGEAPGRDEDIQGKPFIGRAGQLLTQIIKAMELSRDQVYITNVVKCRPPENRTPTILERDTCKNILLLNEIEIINPKIICTLGSPSTKALLGDDAQISKVRGTFFSWNNRLVLPTYHPAYLLRNPAEKRVVWEDMKKIMEKLKELG